MVAHLNYTDTNISVISDRLHYLYGKLSCKLITKLWRFYDRKFVLPTILTVQCKRIIRCNVNVQQIALKRMISQLHDSFAIRALYDELLRRAQLKFFTPFCPLVFARNVGAYGHDGVWLRPSSLKGVYKAARQICTAGHCSQQNDKYTITETRITPQTQHRRYQSTQHRNSKQENWRWHWPRDRPTSNQSQRRIRLWWRSEHGFVNTRPGARAD